MYSGNSSKRSKIDDNAVVRGGKKKVDGRINSGDKNIIRDNSSISGYSVVGDNSGKSSNTKSNNNNTKRNNKGGCHDKKLDFRRGSGDKNVIGPNSQIVGNSILGDNSGNSDNIDDNPVLDNNNNTKSNNNKGGDKIMENLLLAGFDLSGYELDFRVGSGDKNIIGANSQIQGNSIVGDRSGNNTMKSYKKGQRQQQTKQQQQKKAAATTVTSKSAATTATKKGSGNNKHNSNNKKRRRKQQ